MTMEEVFMLGTTLPTDGTGLVMRGDMDGMLANWDKRVTPPVDCCSISLESVKFLRHSRSLHKQLYKA